MFFLLGLVKTVLTAYRIAIFFENPISKRKFLFYVISKNALHITFLSLSRFLACLLSVDYKMFDIAGLVLLLKYLFFACFVVVAGFASF